MCKVPNEFSTSTFKTCDACKVADESRCRRSRGMTWGAPLSREEALVLADLLHLSHGSINASTRLEVIATRSSDSHCQPPQWPKRRWTTGQKTQWTLRFVLMSTVLLLLYVHSTFAVFRLTRLQLGGIGDDGTYSLGDDALLCLKDLRKWLKFGDGQLNRRDVARCMAEANLVKGDLLEILAKISPKAIEDKWRHKIAVATCRYISRPKKIHS